MTIAVSTTNSASPILYIPYTDKLYRKQISPVGLSSIVSNFKNQINRKTKGYFLRDI